MLNEIQAGYVWTVDICDSLAMLDTPLTGDIDRTAHVRWDGRHLTRASTEVVPLGSMTPLARVNIDAKELAAISNSSGRPARAHWLQRQDFR